MVGGHRVGVDPYYLPQGRDFGLSPTDPSCRGRRIKGGMGAYVAGYLVKVMLKPKIQTRDVRALILGLSFEENYSDLCNTRVIDLVEELQEGGLEVDVHYPCVDHNQAREVYDLDLIEVPAPRGYGVVLLAVTHAQYHSMTAKGLRSFGWHQDHVLFDLKSLFPVSESDFRL